MIIPVTSDLYIFIHMCLLGRAVCLWGLVNGPKGVERLDGNESFGGLDALPQENAAAVDWGYCNRRNASCYELYLVISVSSDALYPRSKTPRTSEAQRGMKYLHSKITPYYCQEGRLFLSGRVLVRV